jgi:hypothetical protein
MKYLPVIEDTTPAYLENEKGMQEFLSKRQKATPEQFMEQLARLKRQRQDRSD